MLTRTSRPTARRTTLTGPARALVLGSALAVALTGCAAAGDSPDEDLQVETTPAPRSETSVDNPEAAEEAVEQLSDDLLGAASRIHAVETCLELSPVLAPLLGDGHELVTDEVANYGYPGPGPYEFACEFVDPATGDRIALEGASARDTFSNADVLERNPDARVFAQHLDGIDFRNVTFLAAAGNDETAGSFTAHLSAPNPPESGPTGWITLSYGPADGTQDSDELPDAPSQSVPDEDTAVFALVSLLEKTD